MNTRPRGADRDVEVLLTVRIVVRAPNGGDTLVEGDVSSKENPFAEAVDFTARWYRRFAAGEPAAAMTALTLAQIDAAQAGGTS